VHDFIIHSSKLNNIDWEKTNGRPMTYNERQNAIAAKQVSRQMELIHKVLKSIASDKFLGSEAYLIWRMFELVENPKVFRDTLLEDNYLRFGRSDKSRARALPTDPEIVRALDGDT
jgi:hypothetical protein